MEAETARIAARSRQEAMDWGLVLASQGIEATIEAPGEETSWGVTVSAGNYRPALQAIRQYRIENRGWPWQLPVMGQAYRFDPSSVVWVVLVVLFYWLEGRAGLRSAGAMVSGLVGQGQWWRLFTAVWLHDNVGHLAANATLGFALLGLAMGRYGAGVGPLAAYLAGVVGNVGSWLLASGPHSSLGASGMVMGCVGLLAAQSVPLPSRAGLPRRLVLSSLLAGIMLFLLIGLGPGTDVVAHLGGFLAGLLFGAGLARAPGLAARGSANLACGLVFAGLIILPWWEALRPGRP